MNNDLEEYRKLVALINNEYDILCNISNDELRGKLFYIEQCINLCENKQNAIEKHLVQVYAIVKETARRFSVGNISVTANSNDRLLAKLYDFVEIDGEKAIYKNHWDVMGVPYVWNMVHYDEQLLGGILLHFGYATEMATGEGKTLVATLPVFLNALTHDGVHLMTVNDYLSKRDFETTRPIYMFYGLSADCIEYYLRSDSRRKNAYKMDISFGTNSTFTFDYLWDHIAITPEECVQQSHNFAIVDELDSILIDDADNPHIIGGGNLYNVGEIYKENYPIVKELIEQKEIALFCINKLNKSAYFTEKGKKWLSVKKDIPDLYAVERLYELSDFNQLDIDKQNEIRNKIHLQNVLLQLLLALTVYERDEDYIVIGGKVKIIDQHTGRVRESSRWEHGLHTAMEVKENVRVQDDFEGMAVISLKNYFRLYNKIAGMSGTIMPVQEELQSIYNLRCASLPTHKPLIRKDLPLRIFKTAADKNKAIIDSIVDNHQKDRPILVGSISIKRSEEICRMLDECEIVYNKLDAKTIKDEANLIAKAGYGNTITVSTSVAGRGTDIKPSDDALANGGLMIIGTDLFESVRVDRQLKGRSGRQGNPGSSVFFSSLEDYILKNLKDEDMELLMEKSGSCSESELSYEDIRCYFEKAQANREDYFKNRRKETARKDDIVDPHRKKFYHQRNAVLFNSAVAEEIVDEIIHETNSSREKIEDNLDLLYQKTKELIIRSEKNNPNRIKVYVPFSNNMHTFAVLLEIQLVKASFAYFCKEFKRQIILQIYDKEWKKFVLYMMGNLDKKEIEMLNDRYDKMMNEIHSIILSRLQYATIPFEVRTDVVQQEKQKVEDEILKDKANIDRSSFNVNSSDKCPCGSGKKFCECHGSNIRRNNNKRRR